MPIRNRQGRRLAVCRDRYCPLIGRHFAQRLESDRQPFQLEPELPRLSSSRWRLSVTRSGATAGGVSSKPSVLAESGAWTSRRRSSTPHYRYVRSPPRLRPRRPDTRPRRWPGARRSRLHQHVGDQGQARCDRGAGADPEGGPHQWLVALRADSDWYASPVTAQRLRSFSSGPLPTCSKDPKPIRCKPRQFEYYKHDRQPQAEPEASASEPSTHVVATAVNLWTDAVEGVASDYFDMAEKWMAGGLRLSDVTEFSQKVTGRLVSSPLEFLEKVNQPRYPRGRGSQTEQGGAQ